MQNTDYVVINWSLDIHISGCYRESKTHSNFLAERAPGSILNEIDNGNSSAFVIGLP